MTLCALIAQRREHQIQMAEIPGSVFTVVMFCCWIFLFSHNKISPILPLLPILAILWKPWVCSFCRFSSYIIYQMEFDKTRWFCPWNSDKTVHKTLSGSHRGQGVRSRDSKILRWGLRDHGVNGWRSRDSRGSRGGMVKKVGEWLVDHFCQF